jgi:hypothetical protein
MADALVFGGSNGLVSKLADGLADVLGVRVRYQHSAADHAAPGVAICTTAEAFIAPAPRVVYADDEKPKNHGVDPNRVVALGVIAEALAAGRSASIISSNAEAKRWLAFLNDEGIPTSKTFRKVNIAGEAGVGKTTLAKTLGPSLGLPVVHVDKLFWGNPEAGERGESARSPLIDEVIAGESWLAEGPYWRTSERLAAAADATIYLRFSPERIKRQRQERGDRRRPIGERVSVRVRETVPGLSGSLLPGRLSAFAHLAPILEIRNDEELEAVRAGLLRGAGVTAADGPFGTE